MVISERWWNTVSRWNEDAVRLQSGTGVLRVPGLEWVGKRSLLLFNHTVLTLIRV